MKKIYLILILFTATGLLLAGCGDDTDSRISDDDATCLKILRAGGTCSSVNGTVTSTSTVTSTVTITSTST